MADQNAQETMKVSGISKFTHISTSETEVNFGDVIVGAPASSSASAGLAPTEKEFVLRNRSLVRASFSVRAVESDHDPVFFFSPTSGVVDPESFVTIKVRYTPLGYGTFTCDHFDITTPGSNSVRITCKGRAVGPTISMWKKNKESNFVTTRSVNFQDVAVGGPPAIRVITLRNESPLEVCYHLDAQEYGVFHFDRVSGQIPPLLDRNVTITFAPTQAGNFYRRFFVLIMNQTTLFVDVLGTGYDDKTRPSPFQQAHVDAYRLRVEAGLGLLSPDQLENYQQDHGDALFLKGALRRAKELELEANSDLPPPSALLTRSGEASLAEVEVSHEFFVHVDNKSNPVVVTTPHLDFGNCSIVQFPSKKNLYVVNNTHSKVTCSWRVAAAVGNSSDAFQVFPESCDIAAGATVEFRVAFQPTHANAYYFAELEGYVAFKSNRTFRLVNVDTFTPPWCIVAKVCGNTFPSPTEQFLSKLRFRLVKNKVHFPPCHLGDCVFQTVMIDNAGDTPALFSFVEDPNEIFQCKPACGFIPAKSFHLVVIRFAPRQVRGYSYMMPCVVNNAIAKPEYIEVMGICARPRLALPSCGSSDTNDHKLFIKPTALGLRSTKRVEIANLSRVPLVYRWDIPHKYQGIFDLRPRLGRLNGCESTTIECVFTPGEIREYASRFALTVKSISVAPSQLKKKHPVSIAPLQELTVRAQTKGTIGAIRFEPSELQFATILVNTSSKQHFLLVNTADCDLLFRLEPTLKTDTKNATADGSAPASLTFSEIHGCIPAQSRKKIAVTFQPTSAGTFNFRVACVIGGGASSSQPNRWDFPKFLEASIAIRGDASFPTVEIQDLRVPGLPTPLAWQQFQCNAINQLMAAPLAVESEESSGTELSIQAGKLASPSQAELLFQHFVLPFTPAPLGSPPELAFFLLRNPGNLVVEFSLRLPKEGSVEIEHWAETGAPSPNEVRTNAIIDAKIFELSPRRATLLPHQSVLVTLKYSYYSELYGGKHDLAVRLEVDKGKQIVLELHGHTLAQREPKLFVPNQELFLSPVVIGEYRRRLPAPDGKENRSHENGITPRHQSGGSGPPVQQLQVFNRGDSAFRLDINSAAFDRINAESYGYPVLCCRASSEIVPAKSSIWIDLVFNPIQVASIRAELVLKAHGLMGSTYKEAVMVTVVATAYHPRDQTLDQLVQEQRLAASLPTKQLLAIPGRAARFACDNVDFGHVPMYTQLHRLVILRNQAVGDAANPARAFSYEWDSSHPLVSNGTVAFSPARGDLAPGEKALIRVSVQTSGDTIVVNHSIGCLVTYAPSTASNDNQLDGSARRQEPPRTSVINRSTATRQAAADDRASSKKTRSGIQTEQSDAAKTSKKRQTGKDTRSGVVASNQQAGPVAEPVFVQIYAHVLPDTVFEKHYPHEVIERLPLTTPVHSTVAAVHGTRNTRTPMLSATRTAKTPSMLGIGSATLAHHNSNSMFLRTDEAIANCRDVLCDVVESLVVDVLNSSDVVGVMKEQLEPTSRYDRALLQGGPSDAARVLTRQTTLCRRARQSADCQAILSDVLENTVVNVMQELFHGDLASELLCVPRKAVFPSGVRSNGLEAQ